MADLHAVLGVKVTDRLRHHHGSDALLDRLLHTVLEAVPLGVKIPRIELDCHAVGTSDVEVETGRTQHLLRVARADNLLEKGRHGGGVLVGDLRGIHLALVGTHSDSRTAGIQHVRRPSNTPRVLRLVRALVDVGASRVLVARSNLPRVVVVGAGRRDEGLQAPAIATRLVRVTLSGELEKARLALLREANTVVANDDVELAVFSVVSDSIPDIRGSVLDAIIPGLRPKAEEHGDPLITINHHRRPATPRACIVLIGCHLRGL